jgi:hypothetical protein
MFDENPVNPNDAQRECVSFGPNNTTFRLRSCKTPVATMRSAKYWLCARW